MWPMAWVMNHVISEQAHSWQQGTLPLVQFFFSPCIELEIRDIKRTRYEEKLTSQLMVVWNKTMKEKQSDKYFFPLST